MEEWREVPGFPLYQVSSMGRLRSFAFSIPMKGADPNGRILVGGKTKSGYRRAVLCSDGGKIRKSMKIAYLVALTFLGKRPKGMVIRHLNSDKTDDRVENLSYGTQKENMNDKKLTGNWQGGENHPAAIVNEDDVINIRLSREKLSVLAQRYSIAICTVSAIRTGRLWPHVGGPIKKSNRQARASEKDTDMVAHIPVKQVGLFGA